MIPEYSMAFYTQEEAFRFLTLHREIAKIYNIPFNELYSSSTRWDEKLLSMMTRQINTDKAEQSNPVEDAEVKAEAIGV